jgi:hypothetical protein
MAPKGFLQTPEFGTRLMTPPSSDRLQRTALFPPRLVGLCVQDFTAGFVGLNEDPARAVTSWGDPRPER